MQELHHSREGTWADCAFPREALTLSSAHGGSAQLRGPCAGRWTAAAWDTCLGRALSATHSPCRSKSFLTGALICPLWGPHSVFAVTWLRYQHPLRGVECFSVSCSRLQRNVKYVFDTCTRTVVLSDDLNYSCPCWGAFKHLRFRSRTGCKCQTYLGSLQARRGRTYWKFMLTHQSLVLELVEEEVLTVLYGFVSFCFVLFSWLDMS